MHHAFSNPKKHDKLEAFRHSHASEQWRRKLLCAIHFERNDELRANQTGVAAGLGRRVTTNIIIQLDTQRQDEHAVIVYFSIEAILTKLLAFEK